MSTPCYNCPNRTEKCHANCDDYSTYAYERREVYATRLTTYEINQAIHDMKKRNNRKVNRP